MRFFVCVFFVFLYSFSIHAQTIRDSLNKNPWNAEWITYPVAGLNQENASTINELHNFARYKLRKKFNLASVPDSFIIHVSGDNRYKLYVNEQLVSIGPATGDLSHWNFETLDIAKYLTKGTNTLAALVWNDGKWRPVAQITFATAFILQGNSATEEIINTNSSWKIIKDSSYTPLGTNLRGQYIVGVGEVVNMQYHITGWTKKDFNDTAWLNALSIGNGLPKSAAGESKSWRLVPSLLPARELKNQRLSNLRKAVGVKVNSSFPASKTAVTIPANTSASLLIDQGFLTNTYLTLIFSKGKNAGINLSYTEGLFKVDSIIVDNKKIEVLSKGNRNDVQGKISMGKQDSIISDGSNEQEFTTTWWRTYRYIQINIQTKDEPLVLNDIYGTFTGYPLVSEASFSSGDSISKKILDIGWRTARLCAYDTYMDCPYYEQLQYVGDTRIQALVTMYNTDDDRIVRNAITQINHSRIPEGITLSRYPSYQDQEIPPFSLWWIGMLYDYWMYRSDTNFLKEKLPGERQVLNFFAYYQQPDGSLKNVPYWLFTDWVDFRGWDGGRAPIGKNGYSAVLDIQLMWIYQQAAELEAHFGFEGYAQLYRAKAQQLKNTVQQRYWDDNKKMYADTEEKNIFSQHANALAILSGLIKGDSAKNLAERILKDSSLAQASIYFKYYLHQALVKAGLGNDYMQLLDIWKENIQMGLTTWAEVSDVDHSRSDCHAWGSSPNIEFYRIVLGIDSDAPGFSKIKIEPHLGNLKNVSGSIPHPSGEIAVSYKQVGDEWKINLSIPETITGTFIWKGNAYPLNGGVTNLVLK